MADVGGDVGTVLGTLRHRPLKRFEGAGLSLHWQVDRLPQMASLTPVTVRNLQLLMLECFSNIIQHSRATEVTVRAYSDGEAIIISVADNGTGFDPAATTSGQGTDSMKVRASQMQGSLAVTSTPGAGTSLKLRLSIGELNREPGQ
jgi:signal transduction histidine kinase